MFDNRQYRTRSARKGLIPFTITVKETNLHIQAARDLSREAIQEVLTQRAYLEAHIGNHPTFATSLVPLPRVNPAPQIIREMTEASIHAGVGPMAAVAGAIAQETGKALMNLSHEVIVENGGDVFLKTNSATTFAIFAGDSPLSMQIGIRVSPRTASFSLCTSSGTIGHSKSFGRADAVTILSDSCALADAAATALANRVKTTADIQPVIDQGKKIKGVEGIVVVQGDKIGAWGDVELVPL